jgi:hypothetical protein
LLTSLYLSLSFSQVYQNFLIFKPKNFFPTGWIRTGVSFNVHHTLISLVGITNHVVTTISAFSFIMLLLERILTLIVNRISNTSYHLQYLYYPGGNETGAKPNLITCITEIFLSACEPLKKK